MHTRNKDEWGGVQHVTNGKNNVMCVWSFGSFGLWTQETQRRGGVQHTTNKKKCYVCLEFQNHKVHHQCPTHAQVKNIRVKMFLKKFKNLKPKPTCASRGYTILYTRILTTITPRETTHKTIERQVKKHKCKINELHNQLPPK